MKQIGIYINAFDPVHDGDLDFARSAIAQTNLDKIYFFPEPRPKYNQGVKALNHRIHMVILAVKSDPRLGTIILKTPLFNPLDIANVIGKRFYSHKITLVLPEDRLGKLDSWTWLKQKNKPINLAVGLDKINQVEIKSQIKTINSILSEPIDFIAFKSESPNKLGPKIRRQLKSGLIPNGLSNNVYDYIVHERLYFPSSKA